MKAWYFSIFAEQCIKEMIDFQHYRNARCAMSFRNCMPSKCTRSMLAYTLSTASFSVDATAVTAMTLPLRGKQLAALRAVASTPGGLRLNAYPTALPLLADMGLVIERAASLAAHRQGRAWFLTPAGRETVKAYGEDEA